MIEQKRFLPPIIEGEANQTQPQQSHRTLTAALQGKNLKPQEARAVVAADALHGTFRSKQILVGAHIFFAEGIFRANEVLGFSPDESVLARDMVVTVPRYETLWTRHQLLMQPKFAEVAIYKRAKKTHAEIADILTQMDKEHPTDKAEVGRISHRLAEFGIIKDNRKQPNEFEAFSRKVEKADREAGKTPLPTKELAAVLLVSEQRVSRARKRNRFQGKASSPGSAAIAEKWATIKIAIIASPNKSDAQIAEELSLTKSQVQHRRYELLKAGIIQRKRSLGPSEDGSQRMPSKRFEAKQKLRLALDQALANEDPVVLAQLKKSLGLSISMTTMQNIYREIALEQSVPPLKHRQRLKTEKVG